MMSAADRGNVPSYRPGVAAELAGRFILALENRAWGELEALLSPDVVYEIPQTRERIRGRARYVQFNREFPGDWHLEPVTVLGDDTDGVVLFRWTLDGDTSLAMAFLAAAEGVITSVTDFWPEPYDPPPGREHLVERW